MLKFLKLAVLVCAFLMLHGHRANAAWHTMYGYSAWPQNANAVGLPDTSLYICRAYFEGGVHPGWTRPGQTFCVFGWGGQEQYGYTYDLWVDDWQPASNGNVPANAIAFGYEQAAVPYPGLSPQVPRYACQAYDPAYGIASGKVAPDIGGCDFPWGGVEQHATTYNVLVDSSLSMIDSSIGPVYTVSLADPWTQWSSSYDVNNVFWSGNVSSGYEANGGPSLYVCSTYYLDGYHIGKYRPGFPGCDISFGGQEIYSNNYYYLLNDYFIQDQDNEAGFSGGFVPIDQPWRNGMNQSAIIGGHEQDGTNLYICIGQVDGQNTYFPGRLRSGLGGCSVGLNGREIIANPYEVLGETYTKTPPSGPPR